MNKCRRGRVALAVAVGSSVTVLLGHTRTVSAQQNPNDLVVFHSTATDTAGASSGSFSYGTNWNASTSAYSTLPYTNGTTLSSGTAPTAGYAYVDTGYATSANGFVDTPATSNASFIFQGDSLTIIPTNGQVNIASIPASGNNQCDQFAALSLRGNGASSSVPETTFIGTAGATTGGLILANGGAIGNFGNGFNILNGHINLVPAGVTMDGITTGGSGNPTPSGGIIDTRNNTADLMIINSTITGAGLLHVLASGTNAGSGCVLLNSSNAVNTNQSDSVNNFTGGILLDNTTPFNSSVAVGSNNVSFVEDFPVLGINSPTALGLGTFTVVSVRSGPIITNSTGAPETLTTNNLMNWNGNFEYGSTSGGPLTLSISALDLGSGAVTLGANVNILVNSSTLQDDGNISSAAGGPYTLTKSGAGTLNLTGGSIAVPITVSAGVLNLGSTTMPGNLTIGAGTVNVTGASTFGGTVSVASGGVLELYQSATTFASQPTIASGATLALAVGSSLYTNAGVSNFLTTTASTLPAGAFVGIDTSAGNFTIPDNISGSFGFNKIGTNALTLSGSNSYSGATLLSGGTLTLTSPQALSGTSTLTFSNGTTLDIATAGSDTTFPVNFASTSVINIVSDVNVAGAGINHTLGTMSAGNGQVNVSSGANVTSGTGSITIPSVILTAGTAGTTTFYPTTAILSLGSVTGTSNTVAHTLALSGTSQGNTVTGPITNGNTGVTTLVKGGTGSWTLSGTSTYTGTTTVNAGQLIVTGQINNSIGFNIGATTGSAGAIYQSGASSSITNLSTGESMEIGFGVGGEGYYNLANSGTLNIGIPNSGGELDIGGYDGGAGTIGQLDVTGSSSIILPIAAANSGPYFFVNRGGAGETGIVNLTSGSVQLASGTQIDKSQNGLSEDWSTGQTAIVTIGTIGSTTPSASFLTPTLSVKMNQDVSATNYSTLNLNGGGTLQTLGFLNNSSSGVAGTAAQFANVSLNFNGGTLKAGSAANAKFLQGLGAVYVYGGGGTIDNNGQSITIAQPLLGATGQGVTAVSISASGAGYTAPPLVTFSGGGGTGATGYATISPALGTVTGIVITNPGTGYSSAPSVNLTSIGATTAATIGTVTTANNTVGGLTFQGTGTTTLTGASTYTGLTTVSAGTLVLNGSAGSLASPVTVGPGATFSVLGNTTLGGGLTTFGSGGAIINLADGAISTVNVNGGIGIVGGSVLNVDIGTSAGSNDQIAASGPGSLTGVSTVNLSGTSISNGSYVLLTASGGLTPGGGNLVVGSHPAGRFNSFSFSSSTSTQEILTVSATPFAATDYWTGSASRAAGDTAYNWSTGTTSSNFSVNAAGTTDQNQVPGPITDVVFTASNAKPSSGSTLTTQLDNNYSIQGLFFAVPTTSAQITSTVVNPNGNTLTLGSDGLAVSSTSLSSGTIGTGSLVLGTSQTWANNSSSMALNVNANISSGTTGTTLTVAGTGAGGVNLAGVISDGGGPLGVTFGQTGVTTLGGSNTFTGGATVNAGTVTLANAAALSSGGVTVNGGAVDLGGYSPTFTALNGSGGFVTNSGSSAALTVNSGTYAGVIKDGSGQVSLVKTTTGTLVLSGSNVYSGSTNVSAGTLQVGATNALSPNSVHTIGSSGTLDLNSYSAKIGGLTGSGLVTNNNGGTSTLTVQQPSGTSTFSGLVKDGNGPVALAFTGSGNQNLTGYNTYSGGTTITTGTVTAGTNAALGSGTVTLNGGTLALAYPSGSGALVPVISGFSSSTFTTTTNGHGSNGINGSTLQLTDTNSSGSEATSAFTNTPVAVGSAFVATFQYTVTSPYSVGGGAHYTADGIAFTLQNEAPNVVGINGSGFGYEGISPSAAVVTNIEPATLSGAGTAFVSGGVVPSNSSTNGFSSIDPELGEMEYATAPVTFNVTLTYNASTQSIVETMQSTSSAYTHTFSSVNLGSLIGGNSAYIGFTGSDGGDYAGQSISNFTFSTLGNGPTTLSNNVVALPSTSSVIQLAVSSSLHSGAVGSLSIGSNAKVTVTATSLDGVATHGALTTNGLSLAGSSNSWTGKLDLTNNALVVHGGDLPTITNQVKQGYANGTWQGSGGITSSTAAADSNHLTALGVLLNDNGSGQPFYGSGGTIASTFGGATPLDGDILVKYTYYGDANLDGMVDGSDYSIIDNTFMTEQNTLTAISGWGNGDFNYDGVVDGSDYTLMDNAFNQQGVALTASVASATAQVAGGSAVPEPTSIGLLGMAALGLLGRRRRQ